MANFKEIRFGMGPPQTRSFSSEVSFVLQLMRGLVRRAALAARCSLSTAAEVRPLKPRVSAESSSGSSAVDKLGLGTSKKFHSGGIKANNKSRRAYETVSVQHVDYGMDDTRAWCIYMDDKVLVTPSERLTLFQVIFLIFCLFFIQREIL
jgi:hypothetical protein